MVDVCVQTDTLKVDDLRLMVPNKVVHVDTEERNQIIKYVPIETQRQPTCWQETVVTVEKKVPFVKEVVRTVPVDRILDSEYPRSSTNEPRST
eukprot:Skav210046  [mRNA]  locus=scaffold706:493829:494974:+ [translate_table: standard]